MATVESKEELERAFPPDQLIAFPKPLSFTRTLWAIVVSFAIVDLARVGFGATPFPYDYPFYLGIVYLLALVQMLPRVHRLMDEVKIELVDIAERTSDDYLVAERDDGVTPQKIHDEFDKIMTLSFHPLALLGTAVLGGAFTITVMAKLGALSAYPHLLTNFAYGAGHGLFYAPIIGTALLVLKISRYWIIDIDLLDPDGMGGYRKIGDAIVSLVIFVIIFVTFDFLIISSVSLIDHAPFQNVALLMYLAMILFYFLFTVVSVHFIRQELLELREAKTEMMREKFREIEQQYWQKHDRDEPLDEEADHIQTVQVLYSQLQQMELWPINVWSLAKLVISAAGSFALVALQEGWITVPFAIWDILTTLL